MLIWNSGIKKAVPDPGGGIGIILIVKIISHDTVGGRIEIHPQALRKIIVDGVLPVKKEVPLVKGGNPVDKPRRQIDLPELLFIILPENGRTGGNV